MIAWLSGRLQSVRDDSLVLDVNGVGYHVFVSGKVLASLPAVGERLALEIETQVREDHIHLFGFVSAAELSCFQMLLSVQGVGAKVGLAILTIFKPDELLMALSAKDAKALSRANGVGPKLANRIANELSDKAGALALPQHKPHQSTPANMPAKDKTEATSAGDAVSALTNLGYDRSQAFAAVRGAQEALGEGADLNALITAALKTLAT
ncbi:MAG: Holliday junction branch migration protein RuvA [Pseudomonadota bacterium]